MTATRSGKAKKGQREAYDPLADIRRINTKYMYVFVGTLFIGAFGILLILVTCLCKQGV